MHIFFWGGAARHIVFFFQSCQVGRFCDALGDQAIHSLVLAAGVTALEAREDWRLEMGFIDLLISHASCSYDVQQMLSVEETCDGYEMHFGLNYLSRFNMVGMGRLKCGEKVKVCFVLHVSIQIRACGAICACHYFSRCNFHTIFNLKYFCTLSYFIPKRQNALASQTPWFYSIVLTSFRMSLGSQKEQQSIRQISGQVSRLMENLKKGGTREDPCKVTLHECMHIVPAYVIHACPSTIRQNDIHCFANTHKIGFYWGKQSLIGPILH